MINAKFSTNALVMVMLICTFSSCAYALTWSDCGTPLSRWVSYESITLSPSDAIQAGDKLSLNVLAVVSQTIPALDRILTHITVLKDGDLFLNSSTRDLCTILKANAQGCAYLEGDKISYTYEWDVPFMPRGNYTIRVVSTSTDYNEEVGCAELSTTVEGLDTDQCTYTSKFAAAITGTVQYEASEPYQQTIGNYIQVGPWGRNAGNSRASFSWGRFTTISGTKDIVGIDVVNAQNFIWAINGTLVSMSNTTVSGVVEHTYSGTVIVGYLVNSILNSTKEFVYGGNFLFTFRSDSNARTYGLKEGRIAMFDKYYHPASFPYPLVVGNLNPITLASTVNGLDTTMTASKQWCTCGPNCTDSLASIRTATSTKTGGRLSLLDNAAIAVGVVGFVVVVMASIFFVVHYRASKRPIFDPAEIVYPAKPDYGSMALGEIIDEEGIPDRAPNSILV